MPSTIHSVFVSSTSRDLESYRRAVSEALLTAEILPVSQDFFPPDYREISQLLRDKIRRCDAVICLVGFVYGAAPPQLADAPAPIRSLSISLPRNWESRFICS